MCEFDTEERKQQKQTQTEMHKKMTYGGWKFEQYLCTGLCTMVALEFYVYKAYLGPSTST